MQTLRLQKNSDNVYWNASLYQDCIQYEGFLSMISMVQGHLLLTSKEHPDEEEQKVYPRTLKPDLLTTQNVVIHILV